MTVKEMSKEELSLYRRWAGMKARCNPNIKQDERHRKSYTDKGIRVCPEWQSWQDFRDWAYSNGYSPELTLDRKNGDDDYYPDNCRWVSWEIQGNNPSPTTLKERETRKELREQRHQQELRKRRDETEEKRLIRIQKEYAQINGIKDKSIKLTNIEKFSLWHAEIMGTGIQKLSGQFMKHAITEGLYNPNWEPGTPAKFPHIG